MSESINNFIQKSLIRQHFIEMRKIKRFLQMCAATDGMLPYLACVGAPQQSQFCTGASQMKHVWIGALQRDNVVVLAHSNM